MADNEKFAEEKSTRKKIIDSFEINLARCIVCGICVDVCNFDAIEMSHEHELSKFQRNANRANLESLLDMGKAFQSKIGWKPAQVKNIGDPVLRGRLQAEAKAEVEKLNAAQPKADGKTENSPQ